MKKVIFLLLSILVNTNCANSEEKRNTSPQQTWHCLEDAIPGPNEYNDIDLSQEQQASHTGCEFSTQDLKEFKKHIAQPHNRPPGIPAQTYCLLCKDTQYYSLHPGYCLIIAGKRIPNKSFKPISPQMTSSDPEPK